MNRTLGALIAMSIVGQNQGRHLSLTTLERDTPHPKRSRGFKQNLRKTQKKKKR